MWSSRTTTTTTTATAAMLYPMSGFVGTVATAAIIDAVMLSNFGI